VKEQKQSKDDEKSVNSFKGEDTNWRGDWV